MPIVAPPPPGVHSPVGASSDPLHRGDMTENKGKPRVIVADDEHVIADTLAYILNQAGFEATPVYTGKEAVDLAQQINPDLLITDVIMPDMNGIEAAINIRGFLPSCKVLLFSGQAATAGLLDEARKRGYEFEILSKPVHPQDLVAKLRQ
jgi:CheY-like chemotaxis protein